MGHLAQAKLSSLFYLSLFSVMDQEPFGCGSFIPLGPLCGGASVLPTLQRGIFKSNQAWMFISQNQSIWPAPGKLPLPFQLESVTSQLFGSGLLITYCLMLWILSGFLQDTSSSASRTWTRQGCLHPSSSRCQCSELCQNCMISVRAIRLGWWTAWLWAHGVQILVKSGSEPWWASILTAVQSCHLAGWTRWAQHFSIPSQWLFCFHLNETKCYLRPMDESAHGCQQHLFVQGLLGWRSLTAHHTVPKKTAPMGQQRGLCKEMQGRRWSYLREQPGNHAAVCGAKHATKCSMSV